MEIPAISAATYLMTYLGPGGPVGAMEMVRTTTLFTGLPALITAGGLGRLAAHATTQGTRRAAILHTCAVHAVAGVLLVLIAGLPHGLLPTGLLGWLLLGMLGATAGALCGAGVGLVCAGATPRQVTDVLSLVKLPAATLRQIIDSEDLGRLGAAVRHRASLMFDGLLDPAAPRPPTEAPPAPPAASSATAPPESAPGPSPERPPA